MELKVLKTFLILILFEKSLASILIEKVECSFVDKDYLKVDVCGIKPNPEGVPSVCLTVQLLRVPVTNCMINFQFYHMHKATPLLVVNHTWDACELLRAQKRQALFRKIFNKISKYTNLNHTCPYNNDIYVKNLVANELSIPVPNGNYMYVISLMTNKKRRLTIKAIVKQS